MAKPGFIPRAILPALIHKTERDVARLIRDGAFGQVVSRRSRKQSDLVALSAVEHRLDREFSEGEIEAAAKKYAGYLARLREKRAEAVV